MKISALKYRIPPVRMSNEDVIEYIRKNTEIKDGREFDRLVDRMKIGFKLSGSRYRYQYLEPKYVLQDLIDASLEALGAASSKPEEIDLIIYVGIGRGCLEPASAALVQKRLGAENATCFDVIDACVSWIRGLEIAQAMMKCGYYSKVLLVNCEMGMHHVGTTSKLTPENMNLYFSGLTLGEAATATILSPEGDDFEFYCRTFPEGFGYCMIPMENAAAFVGPEMPGDAKLGKFFALSTQLINTGLKAIETVYNDAGYDKRDPPDLTLIHSVSEKASRALMRNLGLDWHRHFDIHASHGNCVSASIPLGICLANEAGRLKPDTDLLILGGGAGVSAALCRFRVTESLN